MHQPRENMQNGHPAARRGGGDADRLTPRQRAPRPQMDQVNRRHHQRPPLPRPGQIIPPSSDDMATELEPQAGAQELEPKWLRMMGNEICHDDDV